MELKVIELTKEQGGWLEDSLSAYDDAHMGEHPEGGACLGIEADGRLVAGADGCMTAFHIFYVSTMFVAPEYRGRGIGRKLMEAVEGRARALGANLIRLDTFGWQGPNFYRALGYEQVGQYDCPEDGFSEYFFLKRL